MTARAQITTLVVGVVGIEVGRVDLGGRDPVQNAAQAATVPSAPTSTFSGPSRSPSSRAIARQVKRQWSANSSPSGSAWWEIPGGQQQHPPGASAAHAVSSAPATS